MLSDEALVLWVPWSSLLQALPAGTAGIVIVPKNATLAIDTGNPPFPHVLPSDRPQEQRGNLSARPVQVIMPL